MAHRQEDLLPGFLPVQSRQTSRANVRHSPVLEPDESIAHLDQSQTSQISEIRIDPARCSIWSGNGRVYANLTEDRCRDLIDSMIAEGGQQVPAVVRRLHNNPGADYEVIAGTRRHWAVSWLRAHDRPQMAFVATVVELTDEAAFRLADVENRARSDLSELERARNYSWAVSAHYGGNQSRMAHAMQVSTGWLSKLLKMATLPDEVVAAFANPASIHVRGGYELAVKASGPEADELIAVANDIAGEQQAARAAGNSLIAEAIVLRRLKSAGQTKAPGKRGAVLVRAADGRPAMSMQKRSGRILTLSVDLDAKVDHQALLAGLTAALNEAAR